MHSSATGSTTRATKPASDGAPECGHGPDNVCAGLRSASHLWWLYWLALVPSVLGLAMGTAGLFGLPFHPDFLIQPLT